jgi:hypothetical protein
MGWRGPSDAARLVELRAGEGAGTGAVRVKPGRLLVAWRGGERPCTSRQGKVAQISHFH